MTMEYLDLSLSQPEENLALDEALLLEAEDEKQGEILRFWESPSLFVVLGYSNKADKEVDLAQCKDDKIPVLRRDSGGGCVLQGQGCINYSLILDSSKRSDLKNIKDTNCNIMKYQKNALINLIPEVNFEGITDLSINSKKFSGNAQRRKRKFVLFHGTFLLDFDLSLIEKYLKEPEDQPDYREKRSHKDFVTNIRIENQKIKEALKSFWNADKEKIDYPKNLVEKLIEEKYSKDEWNFKY